MRLFTSLDCLLVVVVGTAVATPLPILRDADTPFVSFGPLTGARRVQDPFPVQPRAGVNSNPGEPGLRGLFRSPLDSLPVSSNSQISYSSVSFTDGQSRTFIMKFEQKSIEISNTFREALGMPLIKPIQPLVPFSSHMRNGGSTNIPSLSGISPGDVIVSYKEGDDSRWNIQRAPMVSLQGPAADQRGREPVRQAPWRAVRSGSQGRITARERSELRKAAMNEADRLRVRMAARTQVLERLKEQRARRRRLQGPSRSHQESHGHCDAFADQPFMVRLYNGLVSLGSRLDSKTFVRCFAVVTIMQIVVIAYLTGKRSKNRQKEADGDLRLTGPETAGVKESLVAPPPKKLVVEKAEVPVTVVMV